MTIIDVRTWQRIRSIEYCRFRLQSQIEKEDRGKRKEKRRKIAAMDKDVGEEKKLDRYRGSAKFVTFTSDLMCLFTDLLVL